MNYGSWLLRGVMFLLCTVFFVPFIVANGSLFPNLLFPYITGKVFIFQILIELAAGLYVLLILCQPKYRSRETWLTRVAFAFIAWGAISVFMSVDPIASFWSRFERMDGYLALLHLFIYFLIVGSVITVERWWKPFFQISLVASTLMGFLGVLQVAVFAHYKADGTFGNPTYLAVYLLFGIFIALLLLAGDYKLRLAGWTYCISIVVQFLALYFTENRGALLGLVAGLIIAATFIAVRARTPDLQQVRRVSSCALLAIVLLTLAFLAARDLPVVHRNATLARIASISFEDTTVKPRLHAWRAAWLAFWEKPIFGWGQENFDVVANKFEDRPIKGLHEWLDRAHNQFLDWLVAAGLPMFALYVSLFVLAAWIVICSNLTILEQAALLGLLTAYAFNNLVFFDNLVSATYFWLILAFANSLTPIISRASALSPPISNMGMAVATPIVVIFVCSGIWALNAPGYVRAHELIKFPPRSLQTILNCTRVATPVAC